jgi:hypothetical protein
LISVLRPGTELSTRNVKHEQTQGGPPIKKLIDLVLQNLGKRREQEGYFLEGGKEVINEWIT